MTPDLTLGMTPDNIRIRRIVADVVSSTLTAALEYGRPIDKTIDHWLAQLDLVARMPDPAPERETPPASDEDLRILIADARKTAARHEPYPIGLQIKALADHLENEMLDAMHLRAQLAGMADKASDAIIRTIDARLARLAGQVAPDESHPAEGVVEALKDEIVSAVTEALK